MKVVITGPAGRRLAERLPEAVAVACLEFIDGPLKENPQRVGHPLRPPFDGHWSARRGQYRIRYRIDVTKDIVYVLDVEHRADAYRT